MITTVYNKTFSTTGCTAVFLVLYVRIHIRYDVLDSSFRFVSFAAGNRKQQKK